MAHFVMLWRPFFGWRERQLYVGVDFSQPIRHPRDWGQPRRYEHGFVTDWMIQALEDHYYYVSAVSWWWCPVVWSGLVCCLFGVSFFVVRYSGNFAKDLHQALCSSCF